MLRTIGITVDTLQLHNDFELMFVKIHATPGPCLLINKTHCLEQYISHVEILSCDLIIN